MTSYGEDLAYVNDAGFSDFTEGITPGILGLLRRIGVKRGLVIDLGCGSGRMANAMTAAGYDVLGVDLSPAMIRMAEERAPGAKFVTGSLLSTALPACDAVTAIGEVVNYQFDPLHSRSSLRRFYRKVYRALRPGGLFLFDVAGPERVPAIVPALFWQEGEDWAIHAQVTGSAGRMWMKRKIVCFRRTADGAYRRSEETHSLRLLEVTEVLADLEAIGFRATARRGYGTSRLYVGMNAIVARKPAAPSGRG